MTSPRDPAVSHVWSPDTRLTLAREEDRTAPSNVYGASSAEGDEEVCAAQGMGILRTSWLFGATGSNFARSMLRLAETCSEVNVVDDRVGTPTHAETCAAAALSFADRLLENDGEARGLFHIAYKGQASRVGVAGAVLTRAGELRLPSARVRRSPQRSIQVGRLVHAYRDPATRESST